MVCPFRIDVLFEHEKKERLYTSEKTTYLLKAQREVFSPCMKHKCPYYESDEDYISGLTTEKCTRITDNEE